MADALDVSGIQGDTLYWSAFLPGDLSAEEDFLCSALLGHWSFRDQGGHQSRGHPWGAVVGDGCLNGGTGGETGVGRKELLKFRVSKPCRP